MPSTSPVPPVTSLGATMGSTPVSIRDLVAQATKLGLVMIAGHVGDHRTIAAPRIQKPGLALSGWPEQLHDARVQILGGTEIDYLRAVTPDNRAVGIRTVLASHPACIVVCRGLVPPDELLAECDAAQVPLLTSSLVTADFINEITHWLQDKLAPHAQIHGVLIDVLGVGVLMIGKSGVGKSETALDLVVRGHRLVADDIVHVWPKGNSVLGAGAGVIRHHMEIRGLGIINIKDLFGVSAVRDAKKIELVIELVEWIDGEEYDRLGIDDHFYEAVGHQIPKLRVPVRHGRNLSTLVEVAARNQLLKAQGHHSAREFGRQLSDVMSRERALLSRLAGEEDGVVDYDADGAGDSRTSMSASPHAARPLPGGAPGLSSDGVE